MQITFDGVELASASYIAGWPKHESAPDREIVTDRRQGLQDGDVFVSSRFAQKAVTVTGTVVADTQAALETAVDALKEVLAREQKDLVVTWAGTTRKYVATGKDIRVSREYYDILSAPWSVTFVVADGIGTAPAAVTVDVAEFDAADAEHATTVTFAGTAAPKPKITLTVVDINWARTRGIRLRNAATGDSIVVTVDGSWDVGDKVVIDCGLRKVTSDVVDATLPEVGFYGVFPRFLPGANVLEVQAGSLPIQGVASDAGPSSGMAISAAAQVVAQGFMVPYTDATYRAIQVRAWKGGSPAGSLAWAIYADDGTGKPGAAVSGASGTVAGVTGASGWKTCYAATRFALSAGVRYWLCFTCATCDGSNYYVVDYWNSNPYRSGNVARSADSGATYVQYVPDDLCFRVMAGEGGGTAPLTMKVEYSPRYL